MVFLKYLLIFVGITLILTLSIYIFTWDLQIANHYPPSWHIAVLMNAAGAALLPGSLLALVLTVFLIQRKPGNGIITFAVLWISFSGCFSASYILLKPEAMFVPGGDSGVAIAGSIHSYMNGSVYIENSFTPGQGAVILSPGNNPRLIGGTLTSAGKDRAGIGDVIVDRVPENPFFQSALDPGAGIRRIIQDSKALTSFFIYNYSLSLKDFLLQIATFGLMLTSLWIFARLSSWPLINTIYFLAVVRLALFLGAIMIAPETRNLLSTYIPGVQPTNNLPLIFTGIAAVLILWDIFFVPFDRYNRRRSKK